MKTIRHAHDRGHAQHGWLDTWHSFSFADYHDPAHMGFRSLRVINDDTVAGGGGFGMHPHRDMEIITCVLSGALQHRDSMGHQAVMRAGDVQRISAGTGIQHSEHNASRISPVHLLQIWILPDHRGATPRYGEKSFRDAAPGLTLIASQQGREASLPINQDADVWLGRFAGGETVRLSLRPGRHAWVQVAEGELRANGEMLRAGDGLALTDEAALELHAEAAGQALVFDLN